MKIFLLEGPILDKIEAVVETYFDNLSPAPPRRPKILYLDYEPSEGQIQDLGNSIDKVDAFDGAIAVYARQLDFPEGTTSNTGEQDSFSHLSVDTYGFGDPIEKDGETFPAVREAHKRCQVLTSLSFKAIMDRAEVAGTSDTKKSYGTDMPIDERHVENMKKYSPEGVMTSRRGMCIFRSMYKFKIGEDIPQEALGSEYQGFDSRDTESYNPGDEPV